MGLQPMMPGNGISAYFQIAVISVIGTVKSTNVCPQ